MRNSSGSLARIACLIALLTASTMAVTVTSSNTDVVQHRLPTNESGRCAGTDRP